MTMNDGKNLHDGHRARLIERFNKNPDGFQDHELLELLLFNFVPRKNTNDIAHRLLRTFGSIGKILSASVEELCSVNGVGEKVATGLILSGQILKRVSKEKPIDKSEKLSFGAIRDELIEFFRDSYKETVVILLLDKNNVTLSRLTYNSNSITKSFVDIPEFANALAITRPTYVILAHNHPSGVVVPSRQDDVATIKIAEICAIHGVVLNDHIIVAGNNAYSYRTDGRLEHLTKTYNHEKFFKNIEEKEIL